jgi:hypothetical protein
MDRILLGILLNSGPARKYDIRYFTRQLESVPKEEREHLFENKVLNDSILFKCSIPPNSHDKIINKTVKTLVYLPYDPECPLDGGESFLFSERNYLSFCNSKKDTKYYNSDISEKDLDILSVLDSIPTFSPLILELAFDRASMEVPQVYLDLTDSMRRQLRSLMKSRIRPLIVAAYGSESRKVENAVEELTTKLFTFQNPDEILPFVVALRLPPSEAVDLMVSWVGMTYFEHEYATTQVELKGVAAFLNSNPHRQGNLNRVQREEVLRHVEYVRGKLKTDWAKIRHLSDAYKKSYESLIFHGQVSVFRDFLIKCRSSYWELGDLLARFEQTAIAWNTFSLDRRNDFSVGELLDFLLLLRNLNTVVPIQTTVGNHGGAGDSGFAGLAVDLF